MCFCHRLNWLGRSLVLAIRRKQWIQLSSTVQDCSDQAWYTIYEPQITRARWSDAANPADQGPKTLVKTAQNTTVAHTSNKYLPPVRCVAIMVCAMKYSQTEVQRHARVRLTCCTA